MNLFSFDIILDSLHILSDGDDNGSDHVLYFQRSVKELNNPTNRTAISAWNFFFQELYVIQKFIYSLFSFLN